MLPMYCETAFIQGLLEPLNFLSNIGFLLAAFLLWRLAHTSDTNQMRILSFFVGAVGLGSMAWHFVRTPYTFALDAVFIYVFSLLWLYFLLKNLYPKRLTHLSLWSLFVLSLVVGTWLVHTLPLVWFSGTGGADYLIVLAFAVVLGYVLRKNNQVWARHFAVTVLIFCVSFMFRQVDTAVCENVAVGTHFLWHLLNAFVLYRLTILIHTIVSQGYKKARA